MLNTKQLYKITEKIMSEIFTDHEKLKKLEMKRCFFIEELAEIFLNDGGGCYYLEDTYGKDFTEEQLVNYIPVWIKEVYKNIETGNEDEWYAAEEELLEYIKA